MKPYFPLFFYLFFATLSFAQVGIGTTSPSEASILDITSSDKGLLIPRVALTNSNDVTTIANPVESLLVYNTATSSDVSPGFYYWTGTTWKALTSFSDENDRWVLDGNSISSSNFFGTTNEQPIRLRTNDVERFSFTTSGQLVFNNGIELGTSSNTNSNNAIAIGVSSNAYSNYAIAIGDATNATENAIALGKTANATGTGSIKIGQSGGSNGTNSIAIGTNANSYGGSSVSIGNNASSADNSVALGNDANAYVANTIILGNHNNSALNVGIGTNNPQAKLQVNNSFRYVDGNQSNGKVLTSDADGDASWQTPANQVYGEMYDDAGSTSVTSTGVSLTRTMPSASILKNVSHQNNYLQVAYAGVYEISFSATVLQNNGNSRIVEMYLETAPGNTTFTKVNRSSAFVTHVFQNERENVKKTILISLNSGDRVRLGYTISGEGSTVFPANTSNVVLKRIDS